MAPVSSSSSSELEGGSGLGAGLLGAFPPFLPCFFAHHAGDPGCISPQKCYPINMRGGALSHSPEAMPAKGTLQACKRLHPGGGEVVPPHSAPIKGLTQRRRGRLLLPSTSGGRNYRTWRRGVVVTGEPPQCGQIHPKQCRKKTHPRRVKKAGEAP